MRLKILIANVLFCVQCFGQNNLRIIGFEPDTVTSIKFYPKEGKKIDNNYFIEKYGVSFYLDSLNSPNRPVISKVGYPATAFRRDNTHSGTYYLDSTWNTKDDLPNDTTNFGYYFLTDDGRIVPHPKDLYIDFNNKHIECSRTSGFIIDLDGPERWLINIYAVGKNGSPVQTISTCILNEGYWSPSDCNVPAKGNAKGTYWKADITPEIIDYIVIHFDEKQSFYRAVGLAFDNFAVCERKYNSANAENGIDWESFSKGNYVVLENIEFEFNKAILLPRSFDQLDILFKYLNKNPNIHIEVAGHTDNLGNDEYNQKLSEERAESVVDYLVIKGISKERFISVGYGSSRPIVDNSNDENRQKNRRVEFKIIE